MALALASASSITPCQRDVSTREQLTSLWRSVNNMQAISKQVQRVVAIHLWIVICFVASIASAQGPTIKHIQPDVAAPGMTVAVEMLAHVDSIGAFGSDGLAPAGLSIKLID